MLDEILGGSDDDEQEEELKKECLKLLILLGIIVAICRCAHQLGSHLPR